MKNKYQKLHRIVIGKTGSGKSIYIISNVKEDNKIIESRLSINFMNTVKESWDTFKSLKDEHKKIVYETLSDDFNNIGFSPYYLRVTTNTLQEYLESKDLKNIDFETKMKDIEFYFE